VKNFLVPTLAYQNSSKKFVRLPDSFTMKASRIGSVDRAVIIGQRQRKHQAFCDLAFFQNQLIWPRDMPRMATSG
jgi:hypothetical protein